MLSEKNHHSIYMVGLSLLIVFLPFSVLLTSMAHFLLILNWFLQFNYKEKWNRFLNSKSLWVFLLIIVVHLVSLINTSDFEYALKDLRIKLPLLALPIIIATSKPITQKQIKIILLAFCAALFANTIVGLVVYVQSKNNGSLENIRDISIFISHIRLSLMLNLGIFSLLYFIITKQVKQFWEYIIYSFAITWFVVYLVVLQALTGVAILVFISFFLLIYRLIKSRNKKIRYITLGYLSILFVLIVLFVARSVNDFYPKEYPAHDNLPIETRYGNKYYHDYQSRLIENGHLIYICVCEKEIRQTWQQVSAVSIDSLDGRQQPIIHTLIRYLASLDLTKDSEGIAALNPEDINAIEQGKANVRFRDGFGFNDRIYQLIWQFDVYVKGGNPSGHSVTQRLEYLKTGFYILGNNLLTGVGTGDVDKAFKNVYQEKNSLLKNQFQHRAHNQFLTFFIAFGVLGGIIALGAFLFPIIMAEGYKKYLFGVFVAIAVISMLADDTLETATGSAFFAVFYALFLWGYQLPKNESK